MASAAQGPTSLWVVLSRLRALLEPRLSLWLKLVQRRHGFHRLLGGISTLSTLARVESLGGRVLEHTHSSTSEAVSDMESSATASSSDPWKEIKPADNGADPYM